MILAAFFALFMLVMGTNGRLAKVAKAESSRFAHLDHRLTTLRNRMDVKSAPETKKTETPKVDQTVSQPSAFDPSGGLQGFEMPTS
jgi:hypothetical protein